MPVAARSKVWVCGRSFAGVPGSNFGRENGRLSVVSVVCYHVEVSTTGRSLVQRSPSYCVCVCVSVSEIKCNIMPLYLQL